MVSLASLWLPIVLGAVAVFVTRSVVHVALEWHDAGYRPLPSEDEVRAATARPFALLRPAA